MHLVLIIRAPFHCSQEPTTCPCLKQNNPFHALTSNFFEISTNIILPSNTCISYMFPHQNSIFFHHLPHMCHMPSPYDSPLFDNLIYILWEVQILKLHIMKFPPVSSPFRSRCLPQYPILKLHWPIFIIQC